MRGSSDVDWHMVVGDPKNPKQREGQEPKCYGKYRGCSFETPL